MTNGVSSQIPVVVKLPILIKYIMSWFYRIVIARTTKVFIRKKLKTIFPYGSMIDDSSCGSSI